MSLYLTDKIYIKNDIFYYEKDGKSYKLQDQERLLLLLQIQFII